MAFSRYPFQRQLNKVSTIQNRLNHHSNWLLGAEQDTERMRKCFVKEQANSKFAHTPTDRWNTQIRSTDALLLDEVS